MKEKSRYEVQRAEKEKKMAMPAPPTAKRVAVTYKPVKTKKKTVKKNTFTEDGLIQLSVQADDSKIKKSKSKIKEKKKLAKKVKAIKTLRKEFKKAGVGHKTLPSIRRRR